MAHPAVSARPYNSFSFFSLERSWYSLGRDERRELCLKSLRALCGAPAFSADFYSTLGTRADVDFMLWFRAPDPESLQAGFSRLRRTPLAQHISCRHLFFGVALPSPYTGRESAGEPSGLPYLTVYPFSKTHEWYQLPYERRRELMHEEHIQIAAKFKGIRQFLYYAYGLMDDEFIVAYEMKSIPDYVALVMELRSSKVRPYTLRDTPIFTCLRCEPERLAELLAGL
jgi:chlorite dismutase